MINELPFLADQKNTDFLSNISTSLPLIEKQHNVQYTGGAPFFRHCPY